MATQLQSHAYFDLDGTLLPWDTQLLFCNHMIRRQRWRIVLLLPFFFLLPLAALRIVRSRGMKRLFLSYLTGLSQKRLQEEAEIFSREVAREIVWPEMREEVEARRREGCLLVLNTASPGFYAEPIARELGFDRCFATRVVVPARFSFFPAIDGPNNKRAAKIDAMRAAGLLMPDDPMPRPGSWAYTDSHVDIPLLDAAQTGRLVHPAADLAAQAEDRGWKILRPMPGVPRPVWWAAVFLMMLGLWKKPARP
ncbi:MAG: HAD family hydrolase [Verrucomicrobiales bacterium]